MKVKNRLLNFDNMIIYQDNEYFSFSLDSVLLANFVKIKFTDKKIIDFCSGNAPVPMLLSYRTKARLFGVEIQKYIYELGKESIEENNLNSQIVLLNEDIKTLHNIYEAESFDVVTCNPPYFKYSDKAYLNDNIGKTIARHEVKINIDEIMKEAAFLLRNGGTFALVHRPDRLIEIIEIMKKYHFEPKRLRFVYPKGETKANMILIEAAKNGRIGLIVEPPLIVHDKNGNYVPEVRKMFDEGEMKKNVE